MRESHKRVPTSIFQQVNIFNILFQVPFNVFKTEMIGDGAATVNIFSLVGNTIRVKDAAALAADTAETYTVCINFLVT